MPKLKEPREGERLKVNKRIVDYSRYPVTEGDVQARIFATNPWAIIRGVVGKMEIEKSKEQAMSFVTQAEDFFRAYQSAHEISSKPLLAYYSLHNLVKAYCLCKGDKEEYKKAHHGLQYVDGEEFRSSYLKLHKSNGNETNIFGDFYKVYMGEELSDNLPEKYYLSYIHPQILQGHRIWSSAIKERERFIEIESINFFEDKKEETVWMGFSMFEDDLTRFGIGTEKFLEESEMSRFFRKIGTSKKRRGRKLLKFEKKCPLLYAPGEPIDKLKELVSEIKDHVWSAVTRTYPYRKNYFYLSPEGEQEYRLPQILSIYAFIYYLGSVTRYRPYYFTDLLNEPYGPHIEEIISNVPRQFLFLIASEFASREVAHAPLV